MAIQTEEIEAKLRSGTSAVALVRAGFPSSDVYAAKKRLRTPPITYTAANGVSENGHQPSDPNGAIRKEASIAPSNRESGPLPES